MKQRDVLKWPTRASLLLMLLFMAACHHRSHFHPIDDPDPLPKKVFGADDLLKNKLHKRLVKNGVQIISMGQDYLISIPSANIFADQSPRILWKSYALLNDVACYLKEFRLIGVDISAFSSKYVSTARERALTSARARAVADYLWTQNIDSRFVFTRGLGSDKPIQTNEIGGDASLNSRIEITFRNEVA